MARLVIFDTWIRNGDRHHPNQDQNPCNRDNLFFRKNGNKFDLVALDHSHCFVESTFDAELGSSGLINDGQVYGLFPEFMPFIDRRSLLKALRRLEDIQMSDIDEIVYSVPASWGLSTVQRDQLATMIFDRSAIIGAIVLNKLLAQKELGV